MEKDKNFDINTIHLEQRILGNIIRDNDLYDTISHILKIDYFQNKAHKFLYGAIINILEQGQHVDEITLSPLIESKGKDFNISFEYLKSLREQSYGGKFIENYATQLKESSLKQKFMDELRNMELKIQNNYGNITVEECINSMEEKFMEMISQSDYSSLSNIYQLGKEFLSNLKLKKNTGMDTGFFSLNKYLGGFHRGEMVIIAGRPSMGKTAFATNLIINMTKKLKYSVLLFSIEMPNSQIMMRILSSESKISGHIIKNNQFEPIDLDNISRAITRMENYKFFIDDNPHCSISSIRLKARKILRTWGLDVIVIDYLQLITPEENIKEGRVQVISRITQSLKALAKELNVNIIVLSQLSRAVELREDKRPQLPDLRESGSIEQDADVVMFIYRENYYLSKSEPKNKKSKEWEEWYNKLNSTRNKAELLIDKNRNGPTFTAEIGCDLNYYLFYNLN